VDGRLRVFGVAVHHDEPGERRDTHNSRGDLKDREQDFSSRTLPSRQVPRYGFDRRRFQQRPLRERHVTP
jgi:hypothetical protein